MNKLKLDKGVTAIIQAYESIMLGSDQRSDDSDDKAYSVILRSGKGELVESIAKTLVKLSWIYYLGQDAERLTIDNTKLKIPIKKDYISKMQPDNLRAYIEQNSGLIFYSLGADLHIWIDKTLALPLECKAYADSSTLRRVIADAMLFKEAQHVSKYILLQLESQLGSESIKNSSSPYGNLSIHALLSYFDVELEIVTLLSGERKADKPIHKKEFFKPMSRESIYSAIGRVTKALQTYAK